MPLFDQPARTELSRQRENREALPWYTRLPGRVTIDDAAPMNNAWLPVAPNMNATGQVVHPDKLYQGQGIVPDQVDEYGRYFKSGVLKNALAGDQPVYEYEPYEPSRRQNDQF